MTSTQPIGDLLDHIGFRKEPDETGTETWELPVAPHVVNTSGGLQGGLIANLVDIAAGTLALESLPAGGVVTSDPSVRSAPSTRPPGWSTRASGELTSPTDELGESVRRENGVHPGQ